MSKLLKNNTAAHEWFRLEPLCITGEITLAASSTGICHHCDCAISRRGDPSQIKSLAAPACRTGVAKRTPVRHFGRDHRSRDQLSRTSLWRRKSFPAARTEFNSRTQPHPAVHMSPHFCRLVAIGRLSAVDYGVAKISFGTLAAKSTW